MSRFVVNSNNLWLTAITDRTIIVREGPYVPDLNTHDLPKNMLNWKLVARIGTNRHCTHRELEVFGVVFSGPKVEELRSGIIGNQRSINREGFAIVWRNPSGGSVLLRASSRLRRLNDLYDWSKHGVNVPLPVQTEWDRFELTTGKLMVGAGGGGSPQMKKELEEKEKENERLRAEKDKEIEELKKQAKEKEDAAKKENEELKKQAKEKEDAANKEIEELKKQVKEKDEENQELKKQGKEKDDQLAAKDKQISNLKNALASFT